MDVVYLCRSGENEELRFSLRSIAANLPHEDVWIFGDKPDWVDGVRFVPTIQTGTRFRNTTNAVNMACRHEDVSDPFILMNDDFFIMEPVDGIPVLNRGTVRSVIADYTNRRMGGSSYCQGMANTLQLLESIGHPEPLSYELHVPMVIHKEVMLKAIQLGSFLEVLHKRSLYGNLLGEAGQTIEDVKVYSTDQEVPHGPWASSHDPVFHLIRPVLHYLFPEACCYEAEEGAQMTQETKPAVPTEGVPVYSPNRSLRGESSGVQFVNGNGMIPHDHPRKIHLIDWFRGRGYAIGIAVEAEEADAGVSMGEVASMAATMGVSDPDAANEALANIIAPPEPEPEPVALPFDPSQVNVAVALDFLKTASDAQVARILEIEAEGKRRTTILNYHR